MSNTLKRLLSCIVIICILCCSIVRLSHFLQLKDSDNRYASFFSEPQQIDVFFLGSSHVRHGFYPLELWNDYGITSYNLAANGSTLPVSYWTLVNALDYKKPKLVVLDVFDMWPSRVCSGSWGQVHQQFDAFPLSINKIQMVQDLFNDKNLKDDNGVNIYEKRWDLIFDLSEYHTRWTELVEADFDDSNQVKLNSRIWKGAEPLIAVVEREYRERQNSEGLKYDDMSQDYLKKTINLCNEKDIKLLLINTGYDCSDEAKLFHDSVEQIADDNGIEYIDFTKENIINFNTDLSSTGYNTHVNSSGAQKFTSYIGAKLSADYNLTDHRSDDSFQSWWLDYSKYVNSKHEYLIAEQDIYNYLMLLMDDDYKILIEIRDKDILENSKFVNLLGNLGVELHENNKNLICIDVELKENNLLFNDYESGNSWESILGNISYYSNENGEYVFYLDNTELYVDDEHKDFSQVKINVYSKFTDTWIDTKSFSEASAQ